MAENDKNLVGVTARPMRQLKAKLRQEEVKRLSLANKTAEEIAPILKVSPRTVERDLARIRGRTIQEAKSTPELIWSVKGSYEERQAILKKAKDILESQPMMTKDGRQVDDRFLRLQAIRVIDDVCASLDGIFGVDQVALRTQLDRLKEQLEHLERTVQGRGKTSQIRGNNSAQPSPPS